MTTRCPYCFVDLYRMNYVAFRCVSPACQDVDDSIATMFYGSAVRTRPVTGLPVTRAARPTSANCRLCRAHTSFPVCARCHAPLPPGWMNAVTTCIALAGARASGKSIYIAVMKRQAERLAENLGTSLSYFNEGTERTYEQVYQRPLWQERGLMAATARQESPAATQRAPLIFTLGTIEGRPHILVVRDVAGENLEDPQADSTVFGFFAHADGVLFLFDPMRIEEIRQQLAGVITAHHALGGDPRNVLNNLIRLMRPEGRPITAPIGVVLAKFDTLQELHKVQGAPLAAAMRIPGAAFSRDRSLTPFYDEQDGALLDAEVTSLLLRLNAQSVIQQVRQEFPVARAFAVSALGAAPAGRAIHPRGIAPFRCLDPVKWILGQTGFLSVR